MSYFDGVTDQEIEEELERRKKAKMFPKPLDNPDFSRLINMAKKEIEHLINEGYASKDFDHYVYEEAMTAIYGKDYWKWRNNLDCD